MLLRLLDRLEEWLIATLIASATVIIFLAVLHRYGQGSALLFPYLHPIDMSWAQELCIYMFVWMAKFGAAYGVRTGIHVGVDVLVNRLRPQNRSKVIIFGLLCGALFTGVIGTLGADFVADMYATGQQSNDLEAPMWIVYLAIPLGSYLMCFRFLQSAWTYARTGNLPHHGHHVEGVETSPALHPKETAPAASMETPSLARRGGPLGLIVILLPIMLVLYCFAARAGVVDVGSGGRILMIFMLLVSLMLTGMPISIALGLTVLTFLFTLTQVPIAAVALKLFTGIENFEIMAIPFFILAGNFLTHGGVARRMIHFATTLIGHWYGGLGLAAVVACALFAAITGSSVATVVAIGTILLPEMLERGYPKRFGAGVIATSGALGILFPPSINLVIYSIATTGMIAFGPTGKPVSSASVGQLFIAGIVPGLVLATFLGGMTWYRAKSQDLPRMPRATWAERGKAFMNCFWGLFLIVLVLGGIYSGLFTPTEAAAIAAVYAFVIAVFVYRDLKLADIPRVLLGSAAMSAMILYIVTNAVLFSFLLVSEQIPQSMATWMSAQGLNWVGFLLLVNLLLLGAGNFMDPSAIVLIFAPILFPVAMHLGIDPVHFGIMMAVNMEVGLCHPPVGLNLYITSGIADMGITELTVAVWPWLAVMLVFLVIVTYFPAMTLWLPRLVGVMN